MNDEVTVEEKDDGSSVLIIGKEYFDLSGTLRVNHDWPSSSSFNPMAEDITRFVAEKTETGSYCRFPRRRAG